MILHIEPVALEKIVQKLRDEIPSADRIDISPDKSPRGKKRDMWYVRAWRSDASEDTPIYIAWFERNGEFFGDDWS